MRHRLCMLILLFSAISVYGLQEDSDIPMNITSDRLEFNSKTGITIFTGHVKMDQGMTHLTADKVTVYKRPDGEIEKIIARGNPAHYTTVPESEKPMLEASGDTIEYYPQKSEAIILGNGVIKQGGTVLRGEHLVYDLAQGALTSTPTRPQERTILVIEPQRAQP